MLCRKGFGRVSERVSGRIKAAGEGALTPCDPALTPDETGGPAVTLTAHPCTSATPQRIEMPELPHIRLAWARESKTLRETGLVYYLLRADGAVKIGCTANYPQRRAALVSRHGFLRLIAWEPGYSNLERERHQRFDHLRIAPEAEWFRVDDELIDHVLFLLAGL